MSSSAFNRLWEDQRRWSEATFGTATERGPVGPLKHLGMEAAEAIAAVATGSRAATRKEMADCLLLLIDAAWRAGMEPADLLWSGTAKLSECRRRVYPRVADGEPSEHRRNGQ